MSDILKKVQRAHDVYVSRGETIMWDKDEIRITWTELLEGLKDNETSTEEVVEGDDNALA